jgi:tetratricopeptide (TPR) repeat protein
LAYVERGLCYFAKGEYDRAITECSKAIELDPETADLYYWRSVLRKHKGDGLGADADLARAQLLGWKG